MKNKIKNGYVRKNSSWNWRMKNIWIQRNPSPDPVNASSSGIRSIWEVYVGSVVIHPIYHGGGDFDAWNPGRQYGPVQRPPQPQCPVKTMRGHQCTKPWQRRKDLCIKHWNLAKQNKRLQRLQTIPLAFGKGVRTFPKALGIVSPNAIGRSIERLGTFAPTLKGV